MSKEKWEKMCEGALITIFQYEDIAHLVIGNKKKATEVHNFAVEVMGRINSSDKTALLK